MGNDDFGKITFSWKVENDETGETEKVEFSTPSTIKDSCERLMHLLNQKSASGRDQYDFAINWISKTRISAKTVENEIPDSCKIKIETSTATLLCNLNDFESFAINCGLLDYESTSKSDDVEDDATPDFAKVETAGGETSADESSD